MDIISLVMLILGLIGILFGFLYGKKRGLCKATVRLVLVGIAALMAFLLRETITDIVLSTPIQDGKSILELITEGMASGDGAANMEGLVKIITNILTMVLNIFIFIITFFALRIATLILYWVIAAIIKSSNKRKVREQIRSDVEGLGNNRKLSRKQRRLIDSIKIDQELLAASDELNKEGRKTKKHLAKSEKKLVKITVKRDRKKWWGSLVGILQGALVVICVVGPISGLVSNLSSLIKSLSELELPSGETENGEPKTQKLIDDETSEMLEELGIYTYSETTIAKVYDVAGGWLYRSISTVKNEDGTTTNIESQIEAVDGGVKMADAVSKLAEIEFGEEINEDVVNEIVGIFNDLDDIKEDMSEESIKELDRLMKDALTPMLGEATEELPIDLEKINFANVDFGKEGEVISSFYDLYERTEGSVENEEEIDEDELMEEVITTLSESTLILPLLSQSEGLIPEDSFAEDEKAKIESIIDGLENQENADELKALFGIK